MQKKIKLSEYRIEELPYFKEDNPNDNPYQDFYNGVELLQLVHKMSHIILKKPSKTHYDEYVPSDWHICHQFAFFYNHGCLLDDRSFWTRLPHEAVVELCGNTVIGSSREIRKISNQIEKNKTTICRKYLKPKLDEELKSYKERFFTPQIIASLCAFNINIDQFWYMFLFTIDYIYRITHHVTDYYPTAVESFDELYSITSEIPEDNPHDCSVIDASIVLKYGKRKLKIDNPDTIKLLGRIVYQFCEKYRNEYDEDYDWYSNECLELNKRREKKHMTLRQLFGVDEFRDWRNIKSQTSLYLFRKYMKAFFYGIEGVRNHIVGDFIEDAGRDANYTASINVELLISRLAWAALYLGKEQFPEDKDYLKSLLKKFKPDEKLGSGDYYWTIGVY